MKSPVYTTYSDTDMLASKKAGKMSSEIRSTLILGTIHSMATAASSPNYSEIETMSALLVIRCPCLGNSETGHVSTYYL